MITRFLLFGVIGWCLEIIWTGLGSLTRGDLSLTSHTSIWMFFIYGMGAFFQPLMATLTRKPLVLRGGIYALCIFAAEFAIGYIMVKFQACPWDYSQARYNVLGIIRLDYAPLWFFVGILFEFAHKRLDSAV